jgi:tetratricopeptide (TPR) repeat protein
MPYFRKALALRRELAQSEPNNLAYKLDVARSLLAIGDNSFRIDDKSTAIASFDECIGIIEDIYREKPKILMVKQELARASSLKGDFHLRSGENEKARTLYERALVLTKELVKSEPKKFDYQWDLGHAHYRLGLVALRAKDEGGGREQFESSLAVREKLATQDKDNDRRQMELMLPLAHCGKNTEAAAIAAKLLAGVTDGELLIDVARCYAQCAAASSDEATRQRYATDAIQTIEKSVKQGYRDVVYLSTEVDLDPLRPLEGFGQLLEGIRGVKKDP